MKKVIGILALLVFAGNIASAELLKNMKYNGSMEIKNVTGQKSVAVGKADFSNTNTRLMMGANFDLSDEINAQVTAIKSDYRYYGDDSTGQNVDALTASIRFAEAYVSLKNVLGLNHKFGKQFYGKAGDIVIYYGPAFGGNNTVANFNVSAIDGWYADWNKGKWTVTGLAGKVDELSTTNPQDINLYGVTGKFDYSEIVKATVYGYQADSRNDLVAPAYQHNTLNVFGVKAEGKYMGVGYGAEYAMNMGKNKQLAVAEDYVGNALKVNADYALDLEKIGKFEFMGEFAMGSGDESATDDEEGEFQAVSHNYLPGMIFGTYGVGQTMNGIGNLTTMNAGVKYMPKQIEKLSIGAKFFTFAPTEEPVGYDTYGSELNVCANWKHSENIGLKLSYGMFMPDEDYVVAYKGAGASDATETLMGLDLTLKF